MVDTSRVTRSRAVTAAVAVLAAAATGLGAPAATAATVAVTVAPTVVLNEVSTTNLAGAADEAGKRGDWVELFNTTSAAVDLTGWGLSNTVKSPFRWVFPAGTTIAARGYLRVWTDKADRTASAANLHTNFNIDNGADAVALSAPNQTVLGQLVDTTVPPFTAPDVSWCRTPNGTPGATWTTCLTPTPGAANSGSTATGLLSTPVLSLASGVYPGPQTVTATPGTAAVDAGAVLRYTVDGSAPTTSSPLVTGPIAVAASRTVRVRAFKTGVVPSYPATGTYVVDGTGRFAGQRLMFLSMSPADATSWRTRVQAPSYGWRTAVELLAGDGSKAFAGNAATERAGSGGSLNGQATVPMDIAFKDATGTKEISYPIFSEKPGLTKFKKLRLRNSGDDYQEAHLRDQFWQAVGTEAKLAPSASEPVQVFLNGSYYGMMDLREKEDETLAESSFGIDKDTVQYLSDAKVLGGDNTVADYDALYAFISGNDMRVADNYRRAGELLDLEGFAQDFALHMFALNRDWPHKNIHVSRMPSYDGRWRFRPHDFDISSDGTNAWNSNTTTSRSMNDKYTVSARPSVMMRALLANPTFKAMYANVVADQLNTVVAPVESQARLDAMAAEMAPYIPNQVARNGEPTSVATWEAEVARLRTFLAQRAQYYVVHTSTYLGLGALAPVTVGVDDSARGTVRVGTVDLSTRMTGTGATWTGRYWTGTPVPVTALPRPGFAFTGWSDGLTDVTRTANPGDGVTYAATFAPLAAVPAPVLTAPAGGALTTGLVVSRQLAATDPNGYPLTWSAKSLPNGLDLHPATGMLYGKPTRAGTFAATVTVSNGVTKASAPVTFTVTNQLDRTVTLPTTVTGNGTGLRAQYSNDATNSGTAGVAVVEAPALSLGTVAPVLGYAADGWSVRWSGSVTAPVSGTYTFRAAVRADDGVRASVGGVPLFDAWTGGGTASGTVDLVAGTPTPIDIEFRDVSGSASLAMAWQLPGRSDFLPLDRGVLDPATTPLTGLASRWSRDATLGGTAAVDRVEMPAVSVGSGSGPFPGWPTSSWSVRFGGTLTAPVTGTYRVRATIRTDDGARVTVAGVTADAWTSGATTPTVTVDLVAGEPVPVTLDFWDRSSTATMTVSWQQPGQATFTAVPRSAFAPG